MCLISFKTMTASLHALSVLKSAGIYSQVVNIDPNLTKHGCSYGITFRSDDEASAVSVLKRNRVQYGEVFGR